MGSSTIIQMDQLDDGSVVLPKTSNKRLVSPHVLDEDYTGPSVLGVSTSNLKESANMQERNEQPPISKKPPEVSVYPEQHSCQQIDNWKTWFQNMVAAALLGSAATFTADRFVLRNNESQPTKKDQETPTIVVPQHAAPVEKTLSPKEIAQVQILVQDMLDKIQRDLVTEIDQQKVASEERIKKLEDQIANLERKAGESEQDIQRVRLENKLLEEAVVRSFEAIETLRREATQGR